MSLFHFSVAALNAGLRAIGGEVLTYRRGNDTIDGLIAVPVNTRHDDFDEEQTVLTARERDWIVWAGDLAIGGQQLLPQRGDEIQWNDRLFQVLPRAGDRCYRHTDQTLQQLRVYTVEKVPSAA